MDRHDSKSVTHEETEEDDYTGHIENTLSPSQPQGPSAEYVTEYGDHYTPYDNGLLEGVGDYTQLTASPLDDNVLYSNNVDQSQVTYNNCEGQSLFQADNSFDSQPVGNQEFYLTLSDKLCNLPKDLYTDKLVELCNKNDDDICMFRSVLYKRAQKRINCPDGTLMHRRTTKSIDSYRRYALDCYTLQEFIDNGDPKVLVNVIAKRRMSMKPDTNENSTTLPELSKPLQTELAELKSQILSLKSDVRNLLKADTDHTTLIGELQVEVYNLKAENIKLQTQLRALNETNENINTKEADGIRANPNIQVTVNSENSNTIQIDDENKPCNSNDTGTSQTIADKTNDSNMCTNKEKPKTYAEIVEQQSMNTVMTNNEVRRTNTVKQTSNKRIHVITTGGSREHTSNASHKPKDPAANKRIVIDLTNTELNKQTIETEQNAGPIFESVQPCRTSRYYVGGISLNSNRDGMFEFFKVRNIKPVSIKLIDTKRNSLAAKITIDRHDCPTIEDKQFWPRGMYCRRWYSEMEWESKFYVAPRRTSTSDINDNTTPNPPQQCAVSSWGHTLVGAFDENPPSSHID